MDGADFAVRRRAAYRRPRGQTDWPGGDCSRFRSCVSMTMPWSILRWWLDTGECVVAWGVGRTGTRYFSEIQTQQSSKIERKRLFFLSLAVPRPTATSATAPRPPEGGAARSSAIGSSITREHSTIVYPDPRLPTTRIAIGPGQRRPTLAEASRAGREPSRRTRAHPTATPRASGHDTRCSVGHPESLIAPPLSPLRSLRLLRHPPSPPWLPSYLRACPSSQRGPPACTSYLTYRSP